MAERQQAELNSRRLAAQLTHAARMTTMGHFTAALAHEINQPLATIANFAETCELDLADSITPLSGKLGRQIECIKQSCDFVQDRLSAGFVILSGQFANTEFAQGRIKWADSGSREALSV